jgi:hypothetical protein
VILTPTNKWKSLMVFHVKNAHTPKKIVTTMVSFLMIILALSLFLAQTSFVCAQTGEASLTGTISDKGTNSDADEFFDTLDIGIEVNVTTAGTFTLKVAGLYDSKSTSIDVTGQNTTTLDVGVHVVYVSLDGTAIFESKVSPANVSSIRLYDESDVLIDSLGDVGLSVSYFFGEFGLLPARLTDTITDVGVDTNDDGYYEYLRLGVEVNVTTAGTYTVDAGGIYDTTNNYVSNPTMNTTYLGVGINVVYLDLDGSNIYAENVNPTTIASILLYDEDNVTLSKVTDLELPTSYTFNEFQPPVIEIEFTDIEREVVLEQSGSICVINVYHITNLGFQIENIQIDFPEDAYDFEVRDEMGALGTSTESNTLNVTLRTVVATNETETLYVIYNLPWSSHVNQKDGSDYTLTFTFYEEFNYTIGQLTVDITLPKGAKLQSSTPNPASTKSGVQETMSFTFSDVTPSDDLNFEINYEYNVFWGSFYPTLWVGILAIVASAVVLFWGMPKTASAPTIQVPSKDFRSFIDAYEEKLTIRSDLESLEERLQKGKVPRRQYKVRRKMLDSRLTAITRNLQSLSIKIRSAGANYANLMRQIEVAETKLEGAERDIQRVNARYKQGKISKGAYTKLVDEYRGRIEDAEATIDGVLLRLRE